ncbi:TetR/AcrR family transcriptional regulator [Nocardia sp. NBC_00881]|uniref:TetR/AcrR family transcriptional regulator n=1 Tax=Nocardia sp. NBC_00881 TaxID=2975995 RepID=UPI00386BECDF|nr:TetR/AcrR family transcriptional regulator [Nocardia sp. NBC_00881]
MTEKAERTRLRLLEAAEVVFARRGYAPATVDEIAEEAGMSIGALYKRLGGKEEAFLSVFERYLDQRLGEIRGLSSAAIGADEAAAAWIALIRARRQQLLLFVEFWLYAARQSAPAAQRMSQALREFDQHVESALVDGLMRGEERSAEDARDTARSIIALYRGAALANSLDQIPDAEKSLAEATRRLADTRRTRSPRRENPLAR